MKILASITLENDLHGVLSRGFPQMRVDFIIGGRGSVSEITWTDDSKWLDPGETREVTIHLPWGEQIKTELLPGAVFELKVGSKLIGKGYIIRPVEDQH